MVALIETLTAHCKAKDLQLLCHRMGLSYSGTKQEMAIKIAKEEVKRNSTGDLMIDTFLYLTLTTTRDSKPVMQAHYSQSFSHVDRFNKLMGYIGFKPTIANKKKLVLIGLIQTAIVQSWVLINHHLLAHSDEQEGTSLRQHAKGLAAALYIMK